MVGGNVQRVGSNGDTTNAGQVMYEQIYLGKTAAAMAGHANAGWYDYGKRNARAANALGKKYNNNEVRDGKVAYGKGSAAGATMGGVMRTLPARSSNARKPIAAAFARR